MTKKNKNNTIPKTLISAKVRHTEKQELIQRSEPFGTGPKKTGTSQVGAISRAPIKKGIFTNTGYKKNREKVEQCQKTTPFTLIRFCRLRLKSKRTKGDPLETKLFGKVEQCREQNRNGGPFSPVQFG